MKEDIYALIKKGETFHLECKKAQGGLPSSLWESYSAFPSPSISESYDPDRTTVELKLDEERLAQPTEPKLGQNNKGRVKGRQEVDNKATQGSVKSRVKGRVESRVESRAENGKAVRSDLCDAPASVRQVYKALCKDPSMTYVGLQSKLGLSTQTIAVATATLIKRGLLRRVGPKKGGHWEIVKPQPATGGNGS